MTENELKARSKQMALRVIKLAMSLKKNYVSEIIGRQIVRSATSVAANYRAACKARSKAEFISKLGTVEEEIDETELWLEFITDTGQMKKSRVQSLLEEVRQLMAIFAASRITAAR